MSVMRNPWAIDRAARTPPHRLSVESGEEVNQSVDFGIAKLESSVGPIRCGMTSDVKLGESAFAKADVATITSPARRTPPLR